MPGFRIGIDVGGTFTHAVALEASALDLIAQAKVPTTHRAARGVAEGVVEALRSLLATSGIPPDQVGFVAYSTTQVTNALLEGDVAPVGIVSIGAGLEGKRAARQTNIGDLPLAPGRQLRTFHVHLARDVPDDEASVDAALARLTQSGAKAVVAAAPFSVDDPHGEQIVMARARAAGIPATGTHEISGRYGLRVRTRTAVINASLLPRAIATADMTQQAVRECGIHAPLMVVRSDGGVMSVEEMRRRPLLTLLSGPAAGVAAALMYVRVSEGIFLEVGGTSTDITAIQHGRAMLRTAEVGGHRLFLRTLDVRTIGVAGGSMPRLRRDEVYAVGPRSAHIAGLPYACFTPPDKLLPKLVRRSPPRADEGRDAEPQVVLLSPVEGDVEEYAVLQVGARAKAAITLTCAANAAGEVPEGDFARGDPAAARIAFEALGRSLNTSAGAAAHSVLDTAAHTAARVVEELLEARAMSRRTTELIAGGGGASALAPSVARALGLPLRLAPNAPVVSAIGTALAAVREVVERTVPDATEQDMLHIRAEAVEAVVRAGADAASVTVDVEYDSRTAVLRAVATGHTELRERDLSQTVVAEEERRRAAAKSLSAAPEQVELVADAGMLQAYRGSWKRRRLLGILTARGHDTAVVDQRAVVRLVLQGGEAIACAAAQTRQVLSQLVEQTTRYGDAGAELPQLFLGVRGRIVNLAGLVDVAQAASLAEAEITGMAQDELVMLVAVPRGH